MELSPESRGVAPGRGRLSGRKILVVGGGQAQHGDDDVPGNGRAVSILAGREGAAVVVADLSLELAEETARLVRAEGVASYAVSGDATDESSVQRMLEEASSLMGGLDGIFMNVGIDGGVRLAGTDVDTWERVFAVNARSHFLAVKHGMSLLPDGLGSVVLMSSTSAFSAAGEVPAMSASKASLTALCLHAARENAPRQVRCNVVAPGLIDTPLGRSGGRKRAARSGIGIPMGRFGTAWETAYLVVFLLSNESAYITGQTIVMDGGRLIP
ncbi:NAD(P)-dependent dehydrogenase (short-subunit alcohol dehydrogenase family) [Microbacterium ginsengiterrae]|uniref:NAD(P)-dependent dehydrogenase (Short-subunit alcohol dehydrogenase family) n=1 Tax=Microbacterium ginsengiterrae TaxID=546115 RepID=A0A7W9CBW4_9MICO|nr:SDR family oxidoreductase [Microbacterium ginsengiterrae]MBB5742581.1 NAD(P)-dependent dehydrogenase (short-subunit alcohol dehydrogenase family) [Microbacterium ginsengiterrae]